MSSIRTISNLKSIFQDIATRSKFLKGSFGYGKIFEYGKSNDLSYPVLWVTPDSAVMQKNASGSRYPIIDYTFIVRCLDRVRKKETNEVQVESDTLGILTQIITELSSHPYYTRSDLSLVDNISFTPLKEFSDDDVSGHECKITFRMLNQNTFCGIPFSAITDNAFPGVEISAVTYNPGFLTCATVTACTSFQNYVHDNFVDVTGDTMTGALIINAGPSGFTYLDGNQGAGKVLVTDANGVAYWDNPPAYSLSQFMFVSGASSFAGYKQMVPLSQYSASTLVSYSTGLTTTARVMGNFATNAGQPNISTIPIGNFTFNFDTLKASGSIGYYVHAELYKITTAGTETFLLSSETSSVSILNTNISHSLNAVSTSIINLNTSDRLVAKIMGRTSSSTATASLRIDGSTNAGMIMPIAAATSGDFVPYTNASSSVNLGSFDLTASSIYGNGSGLTGIDHTYVQPGLNTYTGGTASRPTVNISAATLVSLSATSISASTYFSGSTPLATIISTIAASYSGSSSGGGFSGWTGGSAAGTIIANNGTGNIASSAYAIAGGTANRASGNRSFIGNGNLNSATTQNAFVGNGNYNLAISNSVFIGNGYNNIASAPYSFIGTGYNNKASGTYGSVLGGFRNQASGNFSTVGAGSLNSATTTYTTVAGGTNNRATASAAAVGGGSGNLSSGGYSWTAGRGNTASGSYSSVAGGFSNSASGSFSNIGGGGFNTVNSSAAVVAGGSSNTSSGNASIVGGGYLNTASANRTSVLGGSRNSATAEHSSILGGSGNTVSAVFSSILGGSGITATQINTAYAPFLNIQSATTDATVNDVLVRDSTGKVFVRDASTIGTAGNFLPLSGGTVSGATTFQSGLTSNVFYVANYSTTIPGYSNALDTNTGLMFDGPDVLSLHTGGIQRLLINASGAITNGANVITSGFQTELTGVTKVDTISATTLSAVTIVTHTVTGNTTSGLTIDWASASNFDYTLSANTTISFSNDKNGQQIIAAIRQDSTGGFTLTWPAAVMWPNGVEPIQTSGASTFDLYTLIKFNNQYIGSYIQNLS